MADDVSTPSDDRAGTAEGDRGRGSQPDTDLERGLDEPEAAARLRLHGPNEVAERPE